MSEPPLGFLCLLRGGRPRTEPPLAWEARRHALEAAFWSEHLKHFEAALPRIRENRGDERAGRLVAAVLAEVEAAQGTEAALLERGLLLQRWREPLRGEIVSAAAIPGSNRGSGNRCGHKPDAFMGYTPRYPPARRRPKAVTETIAHVERSGPDPKRYPLITHHYHAETGKVRRQARSDGRDRNRYMDQFFANHADYETGYIVTYDPDTGKVRPLSKEEISARLGDAGLSKGRIKRRLEDAGTRGTFVWETKTVVDEAGYAVKITIPRLTDTFFRDYRTMGEVHTLRFWKEKQRRRKEDNRRKKEYTGRRDETLETHSLKGPKPPRGAQELIARINKEADARGLGRQERVRIAHLVSGLDAELTPKLLKLTLKRLGKEQTIGAIIDHVLQQATGPP